MKVLHVAAAIRPFAGQVHQMEYEAIAAKQLEISWSVVYYAYFDEGVDSTVLYTERNKFFLDMHWLSSQVKYWFYAWPKFNYNFFKWLLNESASYDLILIRYPKNNPFLIWFMLKVNKPVVFVHHTLETPEILLKNDLTSKIRAFIDAFIVKLSSVKASALICVTKEILSYELNRYYKRITSFVYPNGIVISKSHYEDRRGDVPELLFIANSFEPWHGLDLLIDDSRKNDDFFVLHVVGELDELDIASLKNDKRFVLHGRKTMQEIESMSEQCWISLSSFALYRQNMSEACTLKVRQSLMLGMPVFAGHADVFPKEFKFYKNGNACFKEILDFAHICRKYCKTDVANTSRPYIDKVSLLDNLYKNLKNSNIV